MDKEQKEEKSFYTEKIVQSPWTKYRKVLNAIRFFFMVLVVFISGIAFSIYFAPYLERDKNEGQDNKEIIYIEKDSYELVEDQNSSKNPEIITEKDLKENYDKAIATLHSRVDTVQKNIVILSNKSENEPISADLVFPDSNEMAGLVIGHINSEYLVLTEAEAFDENVLDVKLSDESTTVAEFMSKNTELGIAIYSIDDEKLTEKQLESIKVAILDNSYKVRQGDMIIAAGKIYGVSRGLDYGIVAGTNVSYGMDCAYEILETNISKSKFDYGFLFNSEGNVIGLSAISDEATMRARGISDLKAAMERLINYKSILYIGINGQNIDQTLSDKFKLPIGIYISNVEINSPAFTAGLQPGDVITSIGDSQTKTLQVLNERLYQHTEGDTLRVTVKRLGKDDYVDVYFDIVIGER